MADWRRIRKRRYSSGFRPEFDRRVVIGKGHMVSPRLHTRRTDAKKPARTWAEIGTAQQWVIGESNWQSRKRKIP
jgi:hypothetical protein